MADELDAAEDIVRNHGGLENDDIGKVLGSLVRKVRKLTNRIEALEARTPAAAQAAGQVESPEPPVDG